MPLPSWRGGTPPKPVNAPTASTSSAVTPGVPPVIRVTQVIIIGSGGELLVYNPSAAAGNLIASVAATPLTDPYGNHVLEGVASYQSGYANAMIGGAVLFYTGSETGGWTFQGQIETAGSGIGVLDFTSLEGAINVPQAPPSISTLPYEPYSGTGWVSGERAWMNSNWVDNINANFNALASLLSAAGIS